LEVKFRNANIADTSSLLDFVKEKAEFDKTMQGFSGQIKTTEERIVQTFFCDKPYAFASFATINEESVGFAVYYFRYSSFEGRPILWLEDLLIRESYRGNKIGENFMRQLYQIANSHSCSHMAWTASKYNIRGIQFYERLGAEIYSKMKNSLFLKWKVY